MNQWWEKYLDEKNDKCWFCGKNGCDEFDTEFDTYLHRQCLINELENNPDNLDALIMKYLVDN
jgi:hypothetical protein